MAKERFERHKQPWKSEEAGQLRLLAGKGKGLREIAKAIGRDKPLVDVPNGFASLLALLPGGPITRDQLAMLGRDNVAAPGSEGLAALGIDATPLTAVAGKWMVRYRRHGRFAGRVSA